MEVSVQAQEKTIRQVETEFCITLPLCPIQILNKSDDTTHLGRATCFTQSTDANADLTQKHFHRHTQR